ncbi:alpha/beta fold hydrolase [Phototrophicus methaneseepsis]|uniref:Alpha/beta fold hydrolase n=1 Tax=Phototrophicus methaneseepsis TaxID=2710758 RepID=A0A7S8ED27_9CHLR|nr:alpha/beta hydrolase [Phototrophicus methaneseepsis]QPC84757.1 alpha/beta fold hydrolase [Phototrophicus methaneseepsis]
MSDLNSHLGWVRGYTKREQGGTPSTWVADYDLSYLIRHQYINRTEALNFLDETGLRDFHWRITWPDDYDIPDEMLVDRITNVSGYAIFIHGWTGNWRIWEELPAMTVLSNRQLVAFSVDHNGFGISQFEDATPPLDRCNPPAAMQTLQKWIDLMAIRRQPGEPRQKVINLIGHSMGAAMLFYLNPMHWRYGEVARFALAPALLLEDEEHRLFYTTLGLGIGILQRLPVLEIVERFIKPQMVNTLASGASDFVKQVHYEQYQATPRGITGATFMAMGRLNNYEIAHDWDLMRVMLGHRDPLVGLTDMMDLLMKLEFPAANLHVVPGTHYMFSIGSETPLNAYQHAQNREMVVNDIIDLHDRALYKQKQGQRFG